MKLGWRRRPLLWLLAATVLGLPLCVSAIIDLWVISKYHPQVEFDPALWASAEVEGAGATIRQRMIRNLVLEVLPGKSRVEIEQLLGRSSTHAEMRRYTKQDLEVHAKDEQGNWKPFPRTGNGYYWDEFDWDLLYSIGREQIFVYDHNGMECSPDDEVLLIRLDGDGLISSWYIDGSTRWPRVVGEQALASFRAKRP